MYRTLLATCGSVNNKCLYLIYNRSILLLFFNEDVLQNVVGPHVASNVRYIAFPLRTNSLLTPCKVRYFHVTPHPSFDYRASSRRLR